MIELKGQKTWNDADNQDGIRPQSLTVHLWADGKEVASKTVTAEDKWTWDFGKRNKYSDATHKQVIQYTITEDPVAGYTASIDDLDITNTHTPEQTTVSGKKTWQDSGNAGQTRPDAITVILKADDQTVRTIKVSAEDNWEWTFENLPKYKDGKEIVYSIGEGPVLGYTSVVNGFDITNTLPSVVPVDPNKPDQPSNPDQPVNPNQPTNPSQPNQPANSNQPAQPNQPTSPGTGDQTNLALVVVLLGASAASLVVLLARRRKTSK